MQEKEKTSAMKVMKERCRFWGLQPFTSVWFYIIIFQESIWAPELPKLEHWEFHNLKILTIINAV